MAAQTTPRPGAAALVMLALLAWMWLLEAVDTVSGNRLDNFGIHAQEIDGLPGIISAPFLHGGWDHLISNSMPFFVLGFLVLLGGVARWLLASLISIIASGLAAWLLTPGDVVILGASGLIFGWLTYLLARGIWSRRAGQVVVAVLVLLVYGGLIFGVLPGQPGISWQAHLGGAVGGVFAAWLLHRRRTSPSAGGIRLLGIALVVRLGGQLFLHPADLVARSRQPGRVVQVGLDEVPLDLAGQLGRSREPEGARRPDELVGDLSGLLTGHLVPQASGHLDQRLAQPVGPGQVRRAGVPADGLHRRP